MKIKYLKRLLEVFSLFSRQHSVEFCNFSVISFWSTHKLHVEPPTITYKYMVTDPSTHYVYRSFT